jgi:hypothetical protein
MLRLLQLEEIEGILLDAPGLVSRHERREPGFAGLVRAWLGRAETALGNCRLPVAAEVAALRSRIVAVERGATPPDLVLRGRVTRRKLSDTAAAFALDRAATAMQNAVSEARGRLTEAERLLRQVLAVAQQKGHAFPTGEEGHWSRLGVLLAALRQDADLAAATTHAVGLVGTQDALILIDRTLPALSATPART